MESCDVLDLQLNVSRFFILKLLKKKQLVDYTVFCFLRVAVQYVFMLLSSTGTIKTSVSTSLIA